MLELAPDTTEDVQRARNELEGLRQQMERTAGAIARSGLGTKEVEETLRETLADLETMAQRADLYAGNDAVGDAAMNEGQTQAEVESGSER